MPVGEGMGALSFGGDRYTENIKIFGKKGKQVNAKVVDISTSTGMVFLTLDATVISRRRTSLGVSENAWQCSPVRALVAGESL
jgi:L-arabinose isomerase